MEKYFLASSKAVSDFNPKEDAQFVKREIALCTNPDKLKQLAARLGELCPGKDISKVKIVFYVAVNGQEAF